MGAPGFIGKFVILIFVTSVSANLRGPFVFFGPKINNLIESDHPRVGKDDLLKIYNNHLAVVVINNQDSNRLSSAKYSKLKKFIERKNIFVMQQDSLDVQPENVFNNTLVYKLNGKSSGLDEEITEAYLGLERIYARSSVLGILGAPIPEDIAKHSDSREKPEELPSKPLFNSSTWSKLCDDFEPCKEARIESPWIAFGGLPAQEARTTKLVIEYRRECSRASGNGEISVKLRFTSSPKQPGRWFAVGAEIRDMHNNRRFYLEEPESNIFSEQSDSCSSLMYRYEKNTVTFSDEEMQRFAEKTERSAKTFIYENCEKKKDPTLSCIVFLFLVGILVLSIMLVTDSSMHFIFTRAQPDTNQLIDEDGSE